MLYIAESNNRLLDGVARPGDHVVVFCSTEPGGKKAEVHRRCGRRGVPKPGDHAVGDVSIIGPKSKAAPHGVVNLFTGVGNSHLQQCLDALAAATRKRGLSGTLWFPTLSAAEHGLVSTWARSVPWLRPAVLKFVYGD